MVIEFGIVVVSDGWGTLRKRQERTFWSNGNLYLDSGGRLPETVSLSKFMDLYS